MIFLSANWFGNEIINYAKNIVPITAVVTLSKNAKTVMYDGIDNECWDELRLPVVRIEYINDEIKLLRMLKPDFIVVAGWRQVIGDDILTEFKDRIIGFHPTKLPFGRGKAPIINSILYGVRYSATSLFYLNGGVDSGDIIGQDPFTIEDTDYAMDVYMKVIESGKYLVRKFFPMILNGTAPRVKQNDSKVVIFGKPVSNDDEKSKRAFSYPYKLD